MPGKVSKNVLRIVAVMFVLCFVACFAIINMYGFSIPTFERYSEQVYSVPWVNVYQDIHYNDCRNPYGNPVIEYHADTDSWSLMNPELFYSKGNLSVVDNEFIIDYTVWNNAGVDCKYIDVLVNFKRYLIDRTTGRPLINNDTGKYCEEVYMSKNVRLYNVSENEVKNVPIHVELFRTDLDEVYYCKIELSEPNYFITPDDLRHEYNNSAVSYPSDKNYSYTDYMYIYVKSSNATYEPLPRCYDETPPAPLVPGII